MQVTSHHAQTLYLAHECRFATKQLQSKQQRITTTQRKNITLWHIRNMMTTQALTFLSLTEVSSSDLYFASEHDTVCFHLHRLFETSETRNGVVNTLVDFGQFCR